MAQNIEIKAHVYNWAGTTAKAAELSGKPAEIIRQHDTFYQAQTGRLKLRRLTDKTSELIYYVRPDQSGPKTSTYEIYETDQPDQLDQLLSASNSRLGQVIKTRHLFLVGPTRIHLDRVQDLGDFLELEVVLSDSLSAQAGVVIAHQLMSDLGVSPEYLIEGAYLDLLLARG
jgi:predicted adenylyl cyclase CyaB